VDWRAILLIVVGVMLAVGVVAGAVRWDRTIKGPRFTGTALTGTSEVLWVQQTTSLINANGVDCRVVNVGLTAEVPGREPYDVILRRPVPPWHLAHVQPGATVAVLVDSENPQNVQFDFDRPIVHRTLGRTNKPQTDLELAGTCARSQAARYDASVGDLLETGQRVAGVLKSFADTGETSRTLGIPTSRPEFLDDPLYDFIVELRFPNMPPLEGRTSLLVPRTQAPSLAIGLELDCVVNQADPSHDFVVDWRDITH
jgi:hypothetical protein